MQVQVDIEFDQLVLIAKKLTDVQWRQLKEEVEANNLSTDYPGDMETFLLNGPTFSKRQLKVIEGNRKAINKWR